MPENHDKKAKHVKATWGRRCNVLIFMSSKEGTILKKIRLKKIPVIKKFKSISNVNNIIF